MQPLLIASLVALLIALIRLKMKSDVLTNAEHWRDYWKRASSEWMSSHRSLMAKYDAQVVTINKLQVDNALLKAELKKKHRRVPQL